MKTYSNKMMTTGENKGYPSNITLLPGANDSIGILLPDCASDDERERARWVIDELARNGITKYSQLSQYEEAAK